MIIPLGQHGSQTPAQLGGKAYHLSELMRRGFKVPSGVILAPDWFQAPDLESLRDHIDPEKLYAVRSSAMDEDSPDYSFAGLQETYLNVKWDQMMDKIMACHASQWSDRANAYRQEYGLPPSSAMAVVIQEMVDADYAGVLFTQHPMTNRVDVVAIDAVAGLGEALVSGKLTPSHYVVSKEGQEVLERQEAGAHLDQGQLEDLTQVAVAIEEGYGSAQDIEWAFVGRDLFVLQSRPITTTTRVPDPVKPGSRLYLSFGHVQNMSRSFTPAGVDMIRGLFKTSEDGGFGKYFLFNGQHLFVDVTDLALLSGPPGLAVKKFMGMVNKKMPMIIDDFRSKNMRRTRVPVSMLKNALGPIGDLIKNLRGRPLDHGKVEGDIQMHIQRFKRAESLDQLLSMRSSGLMPMFKMLLPYVGTGMIAYLRMGRLFKKWNLPMEAYHGLMKGLTGNKTTEMGLLYGDVLKHHGSPRGQELLEAYMATYGMRVDGEIDLGVPRPIEYQEDFLAKVAEDAQSFSGISPRERHLKLRQEGLAIEKDLEASLSGRKWRKLKKWIDLAQQYMIFREHPKYALMTIFQVYRGHLDSPFQSLSDKNNGIVIAPEELAERKRLYDQGMAKTPPLVMYSNGEIPRFHQAMTADNMILGEGVSAGRIKGQVRVIENLGDDQLLPGEILVTRFTDPGWTTVMARASAFIIEVGGMMTHGAVVAREFGVPAVVGVEGAVKTFTTGQWVELNGDTGQVRFLEESEIPDESL